MLATPQVFDYGRSNLSPWYHARAQSALKIFPLRRAHDCACRGANAHPGRVPASLGSLLPDVAYARPGSQRRGRRRASEARKSTYAGHFLASQMRHWGASIPSIMRQRVAPSLEVACGRSGERIK